MLGRNITLATEAAAKVGEMLKGRQKLKLVYNWFKINEKAGSLYDIADLMSVKFSGDAKLEQFISNWNNVLIGMEKGTR